MTLRAKFRIAVGLIALLATVLAAFSLHALNAGVSLVGRLYDEPLMGVNYARAASTSVSEARGLMEQSLLMGPGQSPRVVASLRQLESDTAEDLRIVRQRIHDPGVTRAVDHAGTAITDWFRSGRTILAPPPDGVTAVPMPTLVDRQGAAAMAALDDLVELVAANGFSYRARAEEEMHGSAFQLATLSGSIILMSSLFALMFAHSLINPIGAATRIAEDVAAGRDTKILAIKRRDEIGRLLASLATMQYSLRSRDAQASALVRAQEQTGETLRQTNLRFDTALSNMRHGLLMCDSDGRVVVANRRLYEIYNLDPLCLGPNAYYRDLLAASVVAGNHQGRTTDELMVERAQAFQSGLPEDAVRTIAGGRAISVSYEPMTEGGWIATYEDITERRRSEEQIVFLAWHDPLTSLPNRALFQSRLSQALAQSERGKGFALLLLDLDRFKAVNDSLGHPAGDMLLCDVAGRLRELVREGDTVARLGGDEFAILQLGVLAPADAAALARRIVQIISQPYELEGTTVAIGTSIGIVLVSDGGRKHPTQILKNGDLALYRAKQDGRGTWRFFEPAMDAQAKTRRALEIDLRNAILLKQFEVHYQPIVNSRTRNLTGFEALVRWCHPTRGIVLPGEFISVAEEVGVILQIGAHVVQQACAVAATWPDHLRVAVNLSPRQFRGQTLVDIVTDAVRTAGISPHRLELEITESVALLDDQSTLSILHDLRNVGVRIALDDFGTGYSSLSYLRSFPFDTLKIDRSFVNELLTRNESAAIVLAIIGLGSSMHVNTTAEGVETEVQAEHLTAAGCTELQGYLFSQPVPVCSLPALIDRLSGQEVIELAASGD